MGIFFSCFFISIGTLLAVTFFVYVQDHVSQSRAYGIGICGICTGSMLIAIKSSS